MSKFNVKYREWISDAVIALDSIWEARSPADSTDAYLQRLDCMTSACYLRAMLNNPEILPCD